MQILYRYIFRRGVAASLLVVTTCCVIASLINLFDILDDVVKQNVTSGFLYRYLLTNLIPRVMDIISVMMILAGLFAMGEFNRKLELVSMRAAGLSDAQILRPALYLAGMVLAIVALFQAVIVPRLQQKGDAIKSMLKAGRDIGILEKPFYVQMGNAALEVTSYRPELRYFAGVRVLSFEGRRVSELVSADTLALLAAGAGESWVLFRGAYRKLDPGSGQVLRYEPFDRREYPAYLPSPSQFAVEAAQNHSRVEWMTFGTLVSERSFAARQEIHKRLAMAIATAVAFLVGAWFGMRMARFNAARAICLAMIIGFGHRLILDGFLAFGVETGASWVCHASNAILAATMGVPFLTAWRRS